MANKTVKSLNKKKATKANINRDHRSRNASTTKNTAKKRSQTKSENGSKTEALLSLLRRRSGASIEEMAKATGWQPHSLRGFLLGTVKIQLGLKLTSESENGLRR